MPRNKTPNGQLSLFGDDEPAIQPTSITEPEPAPIVDTDNQPMPMPLRVATKWDFRLQYHIVNGEYWYSVQDWLRGLSRSDKARQMLADIKRTASPVVIGLLDSFQQLEYTAGNGRVYQMDFAPRLTLNAIAQYMRANTGIRDAVLEFLRVAGEFADESFINPDFGIKTLTNVKDRRKYAKLIRGGMTHAEAMQWISVRGKQPVKTVTLRDTWKARGISGGQYGTLTNVVTQVATGRTATEHKRALKVNNSREGLSAYENAVITVVETVSDILHNARDSHGIDELTTDIQDSDGVVNRDELARQMSKRRPRLTDGSK